MNPIKLEVYKHRFRAIAEEMGVTLCRSAYSSNIKERKDFSCALFDAQGDIVSQAEHLPVHLGSMPLSVKAALQSQQLEPGDSILVNDPFAGGTHLPDITMICPVFLAGDTAPSFYVANRAHHADVGGMTPGSMPLSTDIFQEGLRIPPLKWIRQGKVCQDILTLILNNVRTPQEREGDLWAQYAANQRGVERLKAQTNTQELLDYAIHLQDYAETMMQSVLAEIPDGVYRFEDYLDDDGIHSDPLKIQVKLTIEGPKAWVDFSGTSPQSVGCVNTIYAVTLSSVFYAFRCLLDAEVPSNAGCIRPIQLIAPEGSLVNARFPSAVVGGNVETSQRLVDAIFGALAQALPDRVPAASAGTMNNLTIGGLDLQNQPFTYYETIGGGMGASPHGPGLDGIQTHMTNTLNTPIEALEMTYPFRLEGYGLRPNSGGSGVYSGGLGIIRQLRLLTAAQVTLLTERRHFAPYGLAGGEPGKKGRNLLTWPSGKEEQLPGKISLRLPAESIISIETPGGGGWGESTKPV